MMSIRSSPYPTFRYWLNDESGQRMPINAATAGVADTISSALLNQDGSLFIGDSSGNPHVSTITAGDGINVTNGPGSITISNTTATGIILLHETIFSSSTAGLGEEIPSLNASSLPGGVYEIALTLNISLPTGQTGTLYVIWNDVVQITDSLASGSYIINHHQFDRLNPSTGIRVLLAVANVNWTVNCNRGYLKYHKLTD